MYGCQLKGLFTKCMYKSGALIIVLITGPGIKNNILCNCCVNYILFFSVAGEKLTTNLRSNVTPLHSLSISPIEADSSPLQPLGFLKAFSLCKTPGNKAAVKPPSHTLTPVSTASRGSKRIPPAAQVNRKHSACFQITFMERSSTNGRRYSSQGSFHC